MGWGAIECKIQLWKEKTVIRWWWDERRGIASRRGGRGGDGGGCTHPSHHLPTSPPQSSPAPAPHSLHLDLTTVIASLPAVPWRACGPADTCRALAQHKERRTIIFRVVGTSFLLSSHSFPCSSLPWVDKGLVASFPPHNSPYSSLS